MTNDFKDTVIGNPNENKSTGFDGIQTLEELSFVNTKPTAGTMYVLLLLTEVAKRMVDVVNEGGDD